MRSRRQIRWNASTVCGTVHPRASRCAFRVVTWHSAATSAAISLISSARVPAGG